MIRIETEEITLPGIEMSGFEASVDGDVIKIGPGVFRGQEFGAAEIQVEMPTDDVRVYDSYLLEDGTNHMQVSDGFEAFYRGNQPLMFTLGTTNFISPEDEEIVFTVKRIRNEE